MPLLHFVPPNFRLKGVVMTQHYHHLSIEKRYTISEQIKMGIASDTIAHNLGRSRQTIHRELNRNTGGRVYRPTQAKSKSEARRHKTYKQLISSL